MTTVSEVIPEALQPEVDAALAWFNATQEQVFEVTGILDADLALEASAPRELRLVLCGGDTCRQRSFRITRTAAGFDVEEAETDEPAADRSTELLAELDPPPGPRRGWLDSVLARHEFVVLLFYRGFW
jgi:hypothetical protein